MALANRNIIRTPSAVRSGALTGSPRWSWRSPQQRAGALLARSSGDGRDRRLSSARSALPSSSCSLRRPSDGGRPRSHTRGPPAGGRLARGRPRLRARVPLPRDSRPRCSWRSLVAARRPDHRQPAAARRRHRGRALASHSRPAAFAQLLAALAASALCGDPTATGRPREGSRSRHHWTCRLQRLPTRKWDRSRLSWGLACRNAVVALAIPLAALLRNARSPATPHVSSCAPPDCGSCSKAPPFRLPLQGATCWRCACAKLGVGSVTKLLVRYLAASTLVGATAFSLGPLSSAPLNTSRYRPRGGAARRVHAGWVSLSIGRCRRRRLRARSGAESSRSCSRCTTAARVGRRLGHLVVYPLAVDDRAGWLRGHRSRSCRRREAHVLLPLAARRLRDLHPLRARAAGGVGLLPGVAIAIASRRSSSRSG